MQCDSEVEWGPGTADQEDTNTPLSVLPHRPLEVLLTTLWCSAESSEQSVVPHLTCTTPPSCRVHCWCVWTVAHSGVQCSPACMHSSHWSHQHSMTATRRAATRPRLDWTEAGPTLPHSTLVHIQVTECSTATDTHAAGAQDGSQSALTAGPNPTQHTNTSSGLRLQCALTRGARVVSRSQTAFTRKGSGTMPMRGLCRTLRNWGVDNCIPRHASPRNRPPTTTGVA